MPIDPRGLFDVYQELLIKSLRDYSLEQEGMDERVGFDVTEDLIFNPDFLAKDIYPTGYRPIVCVFSPNITPTKSSVNRFTQENCEYTIEMLVKSKGDDDDVSSQLAMRRLRYLIQQTRNAIYRFNQSHFGKTIGELAKKTWPTITTFATNEDRAEDSIVGARMTIGLELEYYPPGSKDENSLAGNNKVINQLIEAVSVDAKYFTAEYVY